MPWGLKLREQVACVPDHASEEVQASSGLMKRGGEGEREGEGEGGREGEVERRKEGGRERREREGGTERSWKK